MVDHVQILKVLHITRLYPSYPYTFDVSLSLPTKSLAIIYTKISVRGQQRLEDVGGNGWLCLYNRRGLATDDRIVRMMLAEVYYKEAI